MTELAHDEVRARAEAHGQGDIFRYYANGLAPPQRQRLVSQVAQIDFDLLDRLIAEHVTGPKRERTFGHLEPAEPIPLPSSEEERAVRRRMAEAGEAALRAGRVGAVVVAGGKGTRLGWDGPKGTFPASPIAGKSLFQLHAEKLLAAQRRFAAPIPWYVMTSAENDAATRRFFEENGFFGLAARDVVFFQQAWLPVVDGEGKILLADRDCVVTSANGHGGTLAALHNSVALRDMRRRGIDVLSYFQVDNVLARVIDPAFVGHHVESGSEFSCKALVKRNAEEGLGAFCLDRGALRVVEYSDLPEDCKHAERDGGGLLFAAGSPAIHVLSVDFIERITMQGLELPYHRAEKREPHLDGQGRRVEPGEKNAVKFEMFIFDALAYAERAVVVMAEREAEFAPIKNRKGPDSPETARRAQIELFARWVAEAGVPVPRDAAGRSRFPIEIGPLYADDAARLRERLPAGTVVDGPLNLQ